MTQRKTVIQERLERYRSGELSESTLKKRRISRMLLFVNLIILVVIFLVFKMPEKPTYFSTGINYGGIQYRVSISRTRAKRYLVSLSLSGGAERAVTQRFSGSVATVAFMHGGAPVMKMTLGDGPGALTLHPGESRNFTSAVDEAPLKAYALKHPEALVPPRRAFLFSPTQHVPLEARITFNTEKPVSVTMNFSYEVPQ